MFQNVDAGIPKALSHVPFLVLWIVKKQLDGLIRFLGFDNEVKYSADLKRAQCRFLMVSCNVRLVSRYTT